VEVTFEVIAAAALLRKITPGLRVRVVNVTDLMILGPHGSHPHALSNDDFDTIFTRDKNIIINYHGYPIEVKGLLFGRPGLKSWDSDRSGEDRVTIEGYREEGTTTSPFDVRHPQQLAISHFDVMFSQMMLCNHTSRYHVAAAAIRAGAFFNPKVSTEAQAKAAYIMHMAAKDKEFIYAHGKGE
jgi:xylulose-5-phosphate/fructose-6-phosphate phosphoketolase